MGNFLYKLPVYTLVLLIQLLLSDAYKSLKKSINGLIPKHGGFLSMEPKYLKIAIQSEPLKMNV